MSYELAIFDMDGTILDTLTDLHECTNRALTACKLPERTYDEVRRFVGNGIRVLIERAVPENCEQVVIDKVFKKFNKIYKKHCADFTKPYEGIVDLLSTLRQKGIKTAVVSNKTDYAVQDLCVKYFDGLFDCAVGVREGLEKKPSPEPINLVLDTLGIDKSKAVYIGDSEVDIATAANSGMECLTVLWGFRTREEVLAAGATMLVNNVEDLIQFF